MSNIRIVTDSSADLPQPVADALDITVVPLYIHFGEDTYREVFDVPGLGLYCRCRSRDAG